MAASAASTTARGVGASVEKPATPKDAVTPAKAPVAKPLLDALANALGEMHGFLNGGLAEYDAELLAPVAIGRVGGAHATRYHIRTNLSVLTRSKSSDKASSTEQRMAADATTIDHRSLAGHQDHGLPRAIQRPGALDAVVHPA